MSKDSLPEPAPHARLPLEVVSVTLALLDFVVFSTDVAVMVKRGRVGADAGGV